MKILVDCAICGYPVYREKSDVKRRPKTVCSKECISEMRRRPRNQITKFCAVCGVSVTRAVSHMSENCCCSKECADTYRSQRFSELNKQLNPSRMTPDTREKIREAKLGTGEGKTYTKTYGRHTHRIVAEQILGRPLKKGEVVHHEDENKRNNDPSNLIIFSSQAEHARYHSLKNPINPKSREK